MTFIKTDLTGYGKRSGGSYVGNNTQNRAIPHGLGSVPSFILLSGDTASLSSMRISHSGYITNVHSGSETRYTVTAADSTNFYVGDATNASGAGNNNGYTYKWMAVA